MKAGRWILALPAGLAAIATVLPGPAADGKDDPVEAFRRQALDLLADRNYDSATTDHFRVRTDDPRLDTGAASAMLESFRSFFEEFWRGRAELHDWEEPAEVLLFYSRYKYNKLYEGAGGPPMTGTAGHYQPYFGVVVAHTDAVSAGDLPGLLIHESAHQLIYRRLYGGEGAGFSRWISEGMSSYFGFTRIDSKGIFRAGEIGGRAPSLLRDTESAATEAPRERLATFRKLMKKAEPGFVDDLIRRETQDLFMVEETHERYTAAWLLVHYLLHGEKGALAGPFVRYLQLDAEGRGGAEQLYGALGRNAETLEAGFVAWVRKLKAR